MGKCSGMGEEAGRARYRALMKEPRLTPLLERPMEGDVLALKWQARDTSGGC